VAADSTSETFAAVDLGSNSFHLLIARLEDGQLVPIDKLKEPVRLAAGLDDDDVLRPLAQARALECLERIGQRLRDMPGDHVRVVGTNTLRKARKAGRFLAKASDALGHEIEILSGAEEARLIYLGVAHSLEQDASRRLVVDIGGGSTECVIGERFDALFSDSLYMGCVSYSLRFFGSGELGAKAFRKADLAARLELETIQERYRGAGWQECVGSSGTINAVEAILIGQGWVERDVTLTGLRRLRKAMIDAKKVKHLALESLQRERAQVLAGGVAILLALFESLDVARMKTSQFALREGLLYDVAGRVHSDDVRDRTIQRFAERYRVDLDQAARVERTALDALEQLAGPWFVDEGLGRRFLAWAARVHEIGLAVTRPGYHKHGEYLLRHADMPGFSREDQRLLALLVRGHRRKLLPELFDQLPSAFARLGLRLCLVLRLAVLLNRSRSARPLPSLELHAREPGKKERKNGRARRELELRFPPGWLDNHPLTRADLEQEVAAFDAAGCALGFR